MSSLTERHQHIIEKLKKEYEKLLGDKDKEAKFLKEKGGLSRKMLENMQKEQRIMSGVFHRMAYELYVNQ